MVELKNLTRRSSPRLPFAAIGDATLGSDYELSLVLCSSLLSRRLNRERRSKDKAANVLSFPLAKKAGEIFIDLSVATAEARRDKVSLRERVGILFIHGCTHLKGHDHGSTMDRIERDLTRRFLHS